MSTIFDVLDEVMDGRGPSAFAHLGHDEIDGFIERVVGFYGYHDWAEIGSDDGSRPWQWAPPKPKVDEIRVHGDTLRHCNLYRLPVLAATLTDEEIARRFLPREILRKLRRMSCSALLYADSVVAVDPFTFVIEGSFVEEEPEADLFRSYFHDAALLLEEARPLIEAGVVILAPDPGSWRFLDHDIELACQILQIEPSEPEKAPAAVRRLASSIYGLRVSSLTDASLVADSAATWRDIEGALGYRRAVSAVDVSVAAGLANLELPFLAGLSIPTLLRVREDEEAFAEWRAQLRMATRLLKYDPSDKVFATEASSVLRDLLLPQAAAVRRATSRSAALRAALRNEPITLGVGGLATGAGAAALGLPLAGVLVSALGGSLARVAATAAMPPKPTGAAKVIFELLR